jgi:hypothetical protein
LNTSSSLVVVGEVQTLQVVAVRVVIVQTLLLALLLVAHQMDLVVGLL